ncbi:hypothetical protein BJ165DRAFT_1488926 [Panaeolus papilionaceus]|nr:hypothetical protein BJ165DRAFT_1488926 [Panaeolus papilionaceus]
MAARATKAQAVGVPVSITLLPLLYQYFPCPSAVMIVPTQPCKLLWPGTVSLPVPVYPLVMLITDLAGACAD